MRKTNLLFVRFPYIFILSNNRDSLVFRFNVMLPHHQFCWCILVIFVLEFETVLKRFLLHAVSLVQNLGHING